MPCTEAYKEHIEYTFNAFCRVVIHYAAINAWRDRDKRRQREISFEYLTEEKFYPFCTSDTYFIDPYKQYPVTICGQRVILTNGNLAEALSSLPEKKILNLYRMKPLSGRPAESRKPLTRFCGITASESGLLPLKTDRSTRTQRTTLNGGLSLPCSSSALTDSLPNRR